MNSLEFLWLTHWFMMCTENLNQAETYPGLLEETKTRNSVLSNQHLNGIY